MPAAISDQSPHNDVETGSKKETEASTERAEDREAQAASCPWPERTPTALEARSVEPPAAPRLWTLPPPRGPPLGDKPSWIDLERVVDLKTAASLKSISVDTLKRRYSDQIIDLSPRRRGMKLKHALGIE
jgi:hypothetical protein